MLDASHNRDVLDAVSRRPFPHYCRCPVFVVAGTNFLNDGIRNQDFGSEALDQVEAGDTREQDER